ncbi:hypothetical protein L218DRAFT_1075815 [Marasmius fiardii PR-910]|nr:hypothetical protein L218DRAFT_1075815 [Marasmius fiardii PR-910]
MSTLAQQQAMHNQHFAPPAAQKTVQLFVGSISGGVTDSFLNDLLSACGPIKSFKRLITPANKPQGFGFVEYEDPDSALRAIALLNGVELPALEDGCANKKLLIKADEKTKTLLDAINSQRMATSTDEEKTKAAKQKLQKLVEDINKQSLEATNNGLLDKEKYVIPPHLHDLQEADLPETQRGLVISEIAMFRERAAKREREKMRDVQANLSTVTAPSGPKAREWGKPRQAFVAGSGPTAAASSAATAGPTSSGSSSAKGKYGYNGFVREESASSDRKPKSDEELERERKDARERDEEASFQDRERRYEPRERQRIAALRRALDRDTAAKEAEERDRVEMRERLDIWDDDESDEMYYVDRARWRQLRARRLEAEEAADAKSRKFEEQEAENLRRESEDFLARQMDEMNALAEEQRKAGLLLDDGAPVKLNVSLSAQPANQGGNKEKSSAAQVFTQEEEEEDAIKKRKTPLVKLDFSVAETGEKARERLERIKESVPQEKEALFKARVRWDGLSDTVIDRKFEPLVKRLMVKYLGEMEEEDLILFVLEHLKDHKSPQKLVDGLEPVLEEEAIELTKSVWRQIIFESMAYGEGLLTEKMLVD